MMTLLLSFWKVSCQGNSAVIDSLEPDYPSSFTFCFPFSDQITVPQRTVSFKSCPMACEFTCIKCMHNLNFLKNITWSELGKIIQVKMAQYNTIQYSLFNEGDVVTQ